MIWIILTVGYAFVLFAIYALMKAAARETPYPEVREIENSAERAALSAAHSEEEEIDG